MSAPSFYVRRERDGRDGWVGPLRTEHRAEREAAAWRDAGWAAEVHDNISATLAAVKAWQRKVAAERAAR
jgi:hypothetical protein